jgi:DnaK suppressor protein
MAKAKKSKSVKHTKTTAKKAQSKAPAKPRKVQPRAVKLIAVKRAVAKAAKKSVKPVRAAVKKPVAKKSVTPKSRAASSPQISSSKASVSKITPPKAIPAIKNIAKKITAPASKVPTIATRPPQRNSTMSNNTKIIRKEVAPGGGIVQPATRTAPEMRLLADDAEILASAKERYGRKDLEAFRKLITEQVQEAREEFEILSQNILDTSGEFEADNQTYSLHTAEQGTDAIEREKTFLHAQRTSDYIKKLDEAIERIDRGTYGICVVCGGLIEKERLQAVPITQKHVDCKNRTQARRPGPGNAGFRDEEPPPHVE